MPFPGKWPKHAYVPGVNARHPEGTFDVLRDTVQPGMEPGMLARSDAFRSGLQYLENGYYWEAHEVLEPVWMALPIDSPERKFVQGLIQIANAHLKLRMKRPSATLRLCSLARNLLTAAEQDHCMGTDVSKFLADLDSLQEDTIMHYKT